jgi:hypothetical protein
VNRFKIKIQRGILASSMLIFLSLLIGILGYSYFGKLSPIDGFLNASMILTGMGPVNTMSTIEGKLFASFYALYSGVVFLTIAATMFGPLFHKVLHKFHLEFGEDTEEPIKKPKNILRFLKKSKPE